MDCLNCGVPHDPTRDGRFCQMCGMSVEAPRPPAPATAPAKTKRRGEEEQVRCAECAQFIDADAGRCRFCGARQRGDALP